MPPADADANQRGSEHRATGCGEAPPRGRRRPRPTLQATATCCRCDLAADRTRAAGPAPDAARASRLVPEPTPNSGAMHSRGRPPHQPRKPRYRDDPTRHDRGRRLYHASNGEVRPPGRRPPGRGDASRTKAGLSTPCLVARNHRKRSQNVLRPAARPVRESCSPPPVQNAAGSSGGANIVAICAGNVGMRSWQPSCYRRNPALISQRRQRTQRNCALVRVCPMIAQDRLPCSRRPASAIVRGA